MFAQIIEGKVSDKAGLRRQLDKWEAEVRPGAAGFVGSTSGVTDDGVGFAIVRFESKAAATANSDRPEQSAWWSETEKCYDGPISFSESEDVEQFLAGGSDDAGFVQVMKMPAGQDRAAVNAMDKEFEKHAKDFRPDLIGGIRVWGEGNSAVDVNYFTSEADARANEKKEPPAELAALFAQFGDAMASAEFLDLRDPWLH